MKILDIYIFKNLTIATLFIAMVLTLIIFLTQSLKFLEIIINAGSSGTAFLTLTGLALPRFFEIILPLSILSATLFLYNKLMIDSELVAMRATGHSSFGLAKAAITLSLITTIILWGITMWIAPKSLTHMQKMRSSIKAEMSTGLFREGVFNAFGNGLTVYIHKKGKDGSLAGLMIHDTRDKTKPPSTVLAKRGMIISNDVGHQVIVFDGARHEFSKKSGILQKLAFERYTIDLPDKTPMGDRWAQPDERTITELLSPDLNNERDIQNARNFTVEIHRRITGPILALTFPLIGLCLILLGPINRRGQNYKIILSVLIAVLIQSLYLTVYNMATKNNLGIVLMYALTLLPMGVALFLLSGLSENLRRKVLFNTKQVNTGAKA